MRQHRVANCFRQQRRQLEMHGRRQQTAVATVAAAKAAWYSFSVNGVQHKSICVDRSVPQDSVLGLLQLISYIEDVVEVCVTSSAIACLLMTSSSIDLGRSLKIDNIRYHLCRCLSDIRHQCASRPLQLNALKTKLLWFDSRSNLRRLSSAHPMLSIGDDVIKPASVVRDLDVCLNAALTMKPHISRVVSNCFFQSSLVTALVLAVLITATLTALQPFRLTPRSQGLIRLSI